MFTKKFESQTYALFRMTLGFLFLAHGTQKLFGFPVESGHTMPALIQYVAGDSELLTGVLVMIGLFTRPAAFLASGTMAVAYWMAHGLQAFWPLVNGGELAVIYCFAFLFVSARGAGIWSLDGNEERPATL